ncbi:MAG TPA: SDR family NAD(P)-dependent oxidoreductase, partial [Dehalococcoidia bacterium]|nr:SDR family NAD(P)-dependent oxidoreductase [Dehalococcoidia bacterium]
EQRALSPDGPLAQRHKTIYPIVQGPMTRVSDRAAFARAVADGGALPFIALALMKADEVEPLLREAKELLGAKSWGVGILGFVPPDLRREQVEQLRKFKPPFALIAGGRPDQAKALEEDGITTYLHVPSPGLLKMFLQEGARRFVLEGRECGGHVGPRSSFVLWNSAVETLLDYLNANPHTKDVQLLFAGGIHDGLSAAMVAAIAAPLVARGVSIGVLSGTAYLFTEEAVRSGAILAGFQNAAIEATETTLLESAPGYATRCVPSPFVDVFNGERQRMIAAGESGEQIKEDLEELNIGRLRIASKGVNRNPAYSQDPKAPRLISVENTEQWNEGMYMIGQVASLRAEVCTIAELHDEISNGSVRELEEVVLLESDQPTAPPPCSVAIVGMSAIVPGASNLETFWKNILDKVDAVTEVPADRWDADKYFDPEKAARDKIYSRWGGFIDEVPFDPLEFGIPPQSLKSIEPFQLMALLMVRDALKDAGYDTRPFNRERTSVILGAGGGAGDLGNGYMVRSNLPMLFGDKAADVADRLDGVLPEWTEDSFAGILMNVAAGRVANRFDFGGVNYTVDAACASSLAAVYLAVRDLEAGTSDAVIVGGVDAIQSPFGFLCFSKTQALSPSGRSRPFDAGADGIAISEGFAALMLKRLEDAERDGDRIYGVIKGVGGSSDGRARGLTAPRPEGQVRALNRAYQNAGFSPATVGLFEAHGTGTAAGDRSELESLTTLLGNAGVVSPAAAVGSVKSMIGHTKATAGVAGLIKVVKALHHRVLPPTIGVETPNPQASSATSPLYVNTESRPWLMETASQPRRAGVSAFGFGGTNFHVVVEEYNGDFQERVEPSVSAWSSELFAIRTTSRAELIEAAKKLVSQIGSDRQASLAGLSLTVNRRAQAAQGSAVLTIVASSVDELRELLTEAIESLEKASERLHTSKGIHYSDVPLADEGKVAFLFPGQGSQYVNMARELGVLFPSVQDELQSANDTLTGLHEQPLSRYIYPPPWFARDEEKALEAALTNTNVAQPALGAVEVAVMRLLTDLGVRADMSAGHSYGEFVALHQAGVFSKQDLFRLSEARGRFMNDSTGDESGTMAAILAPFESVKLVLDAFPEITPANLNAPNQTVISGTKDAIARAIAWCKEQEITARQLPVACAFHSPLVAPAAEKLVAFMQRTSFEAPRSLVFSNTTAKPHTSDPDSIRGLLAKHLTSPVRFNEQVEAMYEAGARLFVEVGPKRVLSGLVDQILPEQPHLCVPTDHSSRPSLWALLNAVAALVSEGVDVDLKALYAGRHVEAVDLTKLDVAPKYGPTTWLVNGGRVRPANTELPKPKLPLEVYFEQQVSATNESLDTPLVETAAASNGATLHTNGATEPAPEAEVLSPPVAMPPAVVRPGAGYGRGQVLEHFQHVMGRYLHTQEAVMRDVFSRRGATRQALPQLAMASESQTTAGAPEPESDRQSPVFLTRRYTPTPRPAAAIRTGRLNPEGAVLILGGGSVATELSALLTAHGYRSALVPTQRTDANGTSGSGGFVLPDDAPEEQVRALVSALHEQHGLVSAVVYLAALDEMSPATKLDRGAGTLFWLSKLLHDDLERSAAAGGAALIGVTSIDGAFGLQDGGSSALQGHFWLPGFVKSVSQEWPQVRVKALDLATAEGATPPQQILSELLSADGLVEVGYDAAGRRQSIELVEDARPPDRALVLDEDAVILVTGGGRGITAECALALAQQAAATYVLVGRTERREAPEPAETLGVTDDRKLKAAILQQMKNEGAAVAPAEIERRYTQLMGKREVEDVIRRFETTGSRVVYRACDITRKSEFSRLIEALYQEYGRIDGVIHGAGVIEDRLLDDKTLDSFERVIVTKVRPLEVLVSALKPESLRFLALFSSVTSRQGNRGQADYSAANEVLNKVALQLSRQWPARVVALGWGPWEGKGMVSPEVMRQFKERGIDLVPPAEGVEMFVREVLAPRDAPAEVVIGALSEVLAASAASVPSADPTLPLLQESEFAQGSDGSFVVRKHLRLASNAYLKDHMLDGKPVLPFAFAMELMAEAASAALPGMSLRAIRDVRVFRGVIVEGDGVELDVTISPPQATDGDIVTVGAAIRHAGNEQIDSYRAVVELEPALAALEADAPASLSEPAPAFTVGEAYRDWLFHGPSFQIIESIDAIGPSGATAYLRATNPDVYAGGLVGTWLMDPVL